MQENSTSEKWEGIKQKILLHVYYVLSEIEIPSVRLLTAAISDATLSTIESFLFRTIGPEKPPSEIGGWPYLDELVSQGVLRAKHFQKMCAVFWYYWRVVSGGDVDPDMQLILLTLPRRIYNQDADVCEPWVSMIMQSSLVLEEEQWLVPVNEGIKDALESKVPLTFTHAFIWPMMEADIERNARLCLERTDFKEIVDRNIARGRMSQQTPANVSRSKGLGWGVISLVRVKSGFFESFGLLESWSPSDIGKKASFAHNVGS